MTRKNQDQPLRKTPRTAPYLRSQIYPLRVLSSFRFYGEQCRPSNWPIHSRSVPLKTGLQAVACPERCSGIWRGTFLTLSSVGCNFGNRRHVCLRNNRRRWNSSSISSLSGLRNLCSGFAQYRLRTSKTIFRNTKRVCDPNCRERRIVILLYRDITEIHSPFRVLFAADTTEAVIWMEKKYGARQVSFKLPEEHSSMAAFKHAAQVQEFSILRMSVFR
jgi:hypothetical protein